MHRKGVVNLCEVEGCDQVVTRDSTGAFKGLCGTHGRGSAREMFGRWRRDSQLRKRMLPTVAGEQDNRCIAPTLVCRDVEDGRPMVHCPFQGRPVPTAMQQLDHITPHHQTQDDRRENLQMLCACCHAVKSAMEAAAR